MRTAPSLLTRHAVGLGVLLLTIVPGYVMPRPHAPDGARPSGRPAPGSDHATDDATRAPDAVEIVTHIRDVAVRYGISPPLVAAIVEAESEFNPRAVSRQGARGLMQLMPRTATGVQVEDPFDPYENVEGGVRHLHWLMERFKGDLPRVLAAYNAGEQAVMAYGGIPPYPETRRFVARILRRIGRSDLVARASGRELTLATTSPPTPVSWGEAWGKAWRERQALERRALAGTIDGAGDARPDAPPSADDGAGAPAAPAARVLPQGP